MGKVIELFGGSALAKDRGWFLGARWFWLGSGSGCWGLAAVEDTHSVRPEGRAGGMGEGDGGSQVGLGEWLYKSVPGGDTL
jgi:hypothetical protein